MINLHGRSTLIKEISFLIDRGFLVKDNSSTGESCRYALNSVKIIMAAERANDLAEEYRLRRQHIDFLKVAETIESEFINQDTHSTFGRVVDNGNPFNFWTGTHSEVELPPVQKLNARSIEEKYREEVGEPSFPQCLFLEDENTPLPVNSTDTTFLLPTESFVTQYSLKEKSSFIKPTTMTETEVILKRYADHPSKFKKEYFRKLSLRALNIKYGDRVDGMLRNFNFEDLETGMRNFLEDQYWREKGTPIDAFMKNPEKYFTPNSGSSEEDETPPTQTFKEAPRSVQQPQEDPSPQMDPERRRIRRGTRRNDALGLLQVVKSPLYDAAWKELEFIDKISDQEIEAWYAIAVEEWTKVKGFTPQAGSVPLLDLTKNLVTQ